MEDRRSARKGSKRAIFSIGYQGRSVPDLINDLHGHRIQVLVDVRLSPISRKPGFSKRALNEALQKAGIDYLHEPRLGNPKENRAGFATKAFSAGQRRYLKHLNNGSRSAYDAVIELSRTQRIALLCLERDDRQCHRGCITDQGKAEHPDLAVVLI